MTQMERSLRAGAREQCGYCGHRVEADAAVPERFGERFCSEAHAEEFSAGVRAARIQAAARTDGPGSACALPPARQRTWKDYLKRYACWGAPLLLLIAIPLFWSGGTVAVAGGSLLSALALLACPLGMYFMMRMMMGDRNHAGNAGTGDTKKPDGAG